MAERGCLLPLPSPPLPRREDTAQRWRNQMAYMPTAVAVGCLREPDMELPPPEPGFARTVRTLLTTAPSPSPSGTRTSRRYGRASGHSSRRSVRPPTYAVAEAERGAGQCE